MKQKTLYGDSSLESRAPSPRDGGRAVRFSLPVPKSFKAKWREEFPCATGIYLRRWYVETPLFSVRVHHWLHSDDDRNFHDHPWWFATLILKGGYRDHTPSGHEEMRFGKIAWRPANHRHAVIVEPGGCWTILLTGPKTRRWGFWLGEKFVKANKYFLSVVRHQCE